jgi:CubicO group peptidase (beta-lactamase class C family)
METVLSTPPMRPSDLARPAAFAALVVACGGGGLHASATTSEAGVDDASRPSAKDAGPALDAHSDREPSMPDAGSVDAFIATEAGSVDAPAQADANHALDGLITAKMAAAQVPGLVAVAVKGSRIVFENGYGLANIARETLVTPDTLFDVASISKTVAAVALLRLMQEGSFGLDDDVDLELPFSARNPAFPGSSITYRMLLSHTSGLLDSSQAFGHVVYGMDSPIPLATFMAGYVAPGGAYYLAANWAAHSAPGGAFNYSNSGSSLVGELVESISGDDLQTYSRPQIFTPLGMNESSWFLAGLNQAHIAMPYQVGDAGTYVAVGYYGYPEYPSGQLRTSGHQLAQFLMMLIQQGTLGSSMILAPSVVSQMLELQPGSIEGLGIQYFSYGGHKVAGHAGVDVGVSTDMWFDPVTGAGFIVLTNSDVYDAHYAQFESGNYGAQIQAMLDLESALLDLAEASSG